MSRRSLSELSMFDEAIGLGVSFAEIRDLCLGLVGAMSGTEGLELSWVAIPDDELLEMELSAREMTVCDDALKRYCVGRRRSGSHSEAKAYVDGPLTVYSSPSGLESSAGDRVAIPDGGYLTLPESSPTEVIWRLWPLVSHVVLKSGSSLRRIGYLIPTSDRDQVEAVLADQVS